MFWKVTLPSTLIFSAKMFAQLTLQFLFTYIFICNRVRSGSFSNGGLRDCDIVFSNETDIAHVFCFLSCLVKFPAREANSWRRRASPIPGNWVCLFFFFSPSYSFSIFFTIKRTHSHKQERCEDTWRGRKETESSSLHSISGLRLTRGVHLVSKMIWSVHRINWWSLEV